MPDVYTAPHEGAPATEPAGARRVSGLCPVSRDDPAYPWHAKPRDHGDDGLFVDGPHMPGAWPLELIADPAFTPTPPTPAVAHGQMAERQRRAERSLKQRPPAARFLAAAARGWEAGRPRRKRKAA